MVKGRTLLLFLLFGSCLSQLLVKTKSGPVLGFLDNDTRKWLGIPFAAPPVGPNRWKSPSPVEPWVQPFSASKWGNACWQTCILPTQYCPVTPMSEDCLNLNVYAPIPTSSNPGPWPVMVFIYGGAYMMGSSGIPAYSGDFIASQTNTILVTGNYRVDVFGWLTSKGLSGNYGIQDQRLMMQWVQDNIAFFGGDASSITLFGESAGAMSTAVHLISPLSQGLFHKAILESDPFSVEMPTREQASLSGDVFAYQLGCDLQDYGCMRNASTTSVLAASAKTFPLPDPFHYSMEVALTWQPNIDGQEIPSQILPAVTSGNFAKVPMILGTNNDEGVMFLEQVVDFVDNAEYAAALTLIFGSGNAVGIMEEYPVSLDPFANVAANMSVLLTDYLFACSGRMFAKQVSRSLPVWLYHFQHVLSFKQAWGNNFKFCWNVTCHGAELVFVFHTADQDGLNFTPEEEILSRQIVTYWTNFAHTSNPNQGASVDATWPMFSPSSLMDMHLQTPANAPEQGYRQNFCDFWDNLGYAF